MPLRKMNIPEHLQRVMASENIEESVKTLMQYLVTENESKGERIKQLESQMTGVTIKVNELERYESKDCLIFHNLPIGQHGSYLSDTVAFMRNILQVNICEEDLKACHPLGKGTSSYPPKIVAKFIYNDQKDRVWARKRLLCSYQNPSNLKPVFITERLTKYDVELKQAAEQHNLFVSTYNSQPLLYVVQDGKRVSQVINSTQDILELKDVAEKSRKAPKPPSAHTPIRNRHPATATNDIETPMPSLVKPALIHPGTPLSLRIPPLKRNRTNLSPVEERKELRDILQEMKARISDSDALVDYVKGLLSETPNAKYQSREHETFRIEETSDSFDRGETIIEED